MGYTPLSEGDVCYMWIDKPSSYIKNLKNICNKACPKNDFDSVFGQYISDDIFFGEHVGDEIFSYEVIIDGTTYYTNNQHFQFTPASENYSFEVNYVFTCNCHLGPQLIRKFSYSGDGEFHQSSELLPIEMASVNAFESNDGKTNVTWTTMTEKIVRILL